MKLTFCVVGVLLILLILARKSDSGGLASAFGGGGGGEALGPKSANQLDRVITVIATVMFVLAILLNIARPSGALTKFKKTNLGSSTKAGTTQDSNTPAKKSGEN